MQENLQRPAFVFLQWRGAHGRVGTERASMAKANVFQFIREVRLEAARVTWPSRQEVIITTVMVLLMVAATAVFFFFVDAILKWLVDTFIYNF